jgi:ubiquinone/menaquinone biosynthesis C-methylase UbiE
MKFTTIAHADHALCSPISEAKLDRVIELLDLPPDARVLDAGCGKGELLIRVVKRWNARGIGVDPNGEFLAAARHRAGALVAGREIEWREAEMSDVAFGAGTLDAAMCVGATHAFGDYSATLRGLRDLVRPGGVVLVGEGFWRRVPKPEYLTALGSSADEFREHASNIAEGTAAALVPLYAAVSSDDEWDHYEGLYARAVERYVHAHPEDPDAGAMRERIRAWRHAYLKWGRETLGFALYLFLKP